MKFDEVLLVGEGKDIQVGSPLLSGSSVSGKVLRQGKSKKVSVVKFRRRQNYLRQHTHRQYFTEVEITDISGGGKAMKSGGKVHRLADYRGKVVLLYFGYTFCPDICPASLAELATAVATLDPGDRDRVQVMMISVDPARDTPEVLGSYMDYFDPTFVGFTGTEEQIATVAADYGVFYQAHEGTAATGYLVDHWAGTYLIDAEGRLVESFGFGTPGEDIAADVEEWL